MGGLSTTTGVPNRYRYNGKELHDELGLNWYDYGLRDYDPATARWVQIDPLAEDFVEWSPYNYSYNSPILFTDPDGASPDCCPEESQDPDPDTDAVEKTVKQTVANLQAAWDFFTNPDISVGDKVDAALNAIIPVDGLNLSFKIVRGEARDVTMEEAIKGGADIVITAIGFAAAGAKYADDLSRLADDVADVSKATSKIPSKSITSKGSSNASKGTDYVVSPKGEAIKIPSGATGPTNPNKGSGMMYQGGSGGKGMNKRTTGVRIMDANSNQGRRVNYMNKNGQTVDPASGRTISNKDPRGHLPLKDY